MPVSLVLAALVLGVATPLQRPVPAQAAETPAAVVRRARQAVAHDSAAPVGAAWTRRLASRPDDGAARLGLATLAALAYDLPRAERHYLALLAPGVARDWSAAGRTGLAVVRVQQARGPEAESLLVRAAADARAVAESTVAADAMLALTELRARRSIPSGLATLDSAARLAPASEPRFRLAITCRRARFAAARGDSTELPAARAAADEARALGEPRLVAACLNVVAVSHSTHFRVAEAIAALAPVAAAQRAARDRYGLAETLMRTAYSTALSSDYVGAMRLARDAIREGRATRNLVAEAWAHNTIVLAAGVLGDLRLQEEHRAHAERLFRAAGDMNGLANAVAARGDAAVTARRWADARAAYRDARAIRAGQGNADTERLDLQARRHLAMTQQDWAAARALNDSLQARLVQDGRTALVQTTRDEEGVIAMKQGALERADSAFALYFGTLLPTDHVLRARIQSYRAELAARRGDAAGAERALVAANDELDDWRARVAEPELRRLAFQANGGYVPPALGLAAATLVRAGRADAAFALAERRRARELLDALRRAEALARRETPPDASRASSLGAPRATTAALVAAALPDSTALLEYQLGADDGPAILYVVTRGGLRAHVLGRADSLGADGARLSALLEGGARPTAAAARLGDGLLGEALRALPADVRHLVIVPDAQLHRLPFDALVANGRPVAARFAVSVAPSAAVALALWARPRAAPGGGAIALGDPAFRGEGLFDDLADYFGLADSPAAGALPRLPGSAREARRVAARTGGTARLRRDASEAFLKGAAAADATVLHLATHATVDETASLRTALALAPGDGEDGRVTPAELAALRLRADLVVLSACRTAGGALVAGEGVRGLATPLLEAGARAVIATQWAVSDRAIEPVVDALYRRLAEGLPAAEALRRAKQDAARAGVPASAWAAFTLVGDGSRPVRLGAAATARATAPER